MKLIQLKRHNLSQYASILPDALLRRPGEIFICSENEIPYGVLSLEKLGSALGINWLWTAPEKRRQKLGSALLLKACQFAKQHQYAALTIVYDPDESWAAILEYMLAKKGFHLMMSPFSKYRITKETLLSSPLMRSFPMAKERPQYTQSLASLSPKALTKLLFQCQKDHNLLLSSSSFSNADPQKTRLIYEGSRLKGLTLVNSTNTPGEYELALAYLNPAYITLGPILFRETAAELLKDSDRFSALYFTCVVNTSVRLADALLGTGEKNVKQMCHGILEIAIPSQERR